MDGLDGETQWMARRGWLDVVGYYSLRPGRQSTMSPTCPNIDRYNNTRGVVSVVTGGENGGHKSCTLHRQISIINWVPWITDTKQVERPRTTQSQLLSTNYSYYYRT